MLIQRKQRQYLPKIALFSADSPQHNVTPDHSFNEDLTPSSNANDKSSLTSNLTHTPRTSRLAYLRNRMLTREDPTLLLISKFKPDRSRRNTLIGSYDFSSVSKKAEKGQESKNVLNIPKEKSTVQKKEMRLPTKSTSVEQYFFKYKTNKRMNNLIQKHKEELKNCYGTLPVLVKQSKSHLKNPYTQSLMKPMIRSFGKRPRKVSNQANKK